MEIQDQENTPEQKELAGVSVIFHNITERIQSWVDAVTDAGATVYEEGSDGVIALKDHTTLKVAVIIGPTTDETHLTKIIQEHEEYFSDPVISVRYFLFVRKGEEPEFSHEKIEIVYYEDIAPNKTPEMINTVLYESRLPDFLRTGYDVEICEELEPFDGNKYRKIIVRSYEDGRKKLDYESRSLFIHNMKLHELRDGVMVEIDESSDIGVNKGSFVGHVTLTRLNEDKKKESQNKIPTHETSDGLREAVC